MAYTKTNWQNLPNTSSAVNKTNLNKIETELKYLDDCNTLQLPETEIPSNADLNNYTTVGSYLISTAAISATLSNIPTEINTAFKLVVENVNRTDRIRQTIITNTLQCDTYVRYNNGSWGEWRKVITEKETVQYGNWHAMLPCRSDNNYIYVFCYGSELLKNGTYSIASDLVFQFFGILGSEANTGATVTVPISAISFYRYDWGIELRINRSGVTNLPSGNYNGFIIPNTNQLIIQSN